MNTQPPVIDNKDENKNGVNSDENMGVNKTKHPEEIFNIEICPVNFEKNKDIAKASRFVLSSEKKKKITPDFIDIRELSPGKDHSSPIKRKTQIDTVEEKKAPTTIKHDSKEFGHNVSLKFDDSTANNRSILKDVSCFSIKTEIKSGDLFAPTGKKIQLTDECTVNSTIPKGYVFGSLYKDKNLKNTNVNMLTSNEIDISKKIDTNKLPGFEASTPMFEKIGEAAKYASIEHKDGEEYDENVVDIKAKMYIFESKNWQPVGLVSVRLNDSLTEADPYSRLIIRLNETHRLMVNSRISSNTACDKMQEDQIKLTIIDHETSKPKIICIKTKKADIFFKELISRIEARKIT